MIGSVSIACVVMSLPGAAAFARPIRGITMGNAFDARIKPTADPNEAPSPAALREKANSLEQYKLFGGRSIYDVLNNAAADLRACADALEAKDREIAEVDAVIAWELNLHCEGLSAPENEAKIIKDAIVRHRARIEAIRARGKEPKP